MNDFSTLLLNFYLFNYYFFHELLCLGELIFFFPFGAIQGHC